MDWRFGFGKKDPRSHMAERQETRKDPVTTVVDALRARVEKMYSQTEAKRIHPAGHRFGPGTLMGETKNCYFIETDGSFSAHYFNDLGLTEGPHYAVRHLEKDGVRLGPREFTVDAALLEEKLGIQRARIGRPDR